MGCKNSTSTAVDKPEKRSSEKPAEESQPVPEKAEEKAEEQPEEQSEELLIAPKPKGIGLHGYYDVDAAPFDGDNILNLAPEFLAELLGELEEDGQVMDDKTTLGNWLKENPGQMRKVYWNKPQETYDALLKWLQSEVKCTEKDATIMCKAFTRMEFKLAETQGIYESDPEKYKENQDKMKFCFE